METDKKVTLNINMDSVKSTDLETVAYLMACVSHIRLNGKNVECQMKNPKNLTIEKFLQKSGFNEFIYSNAQDLKFIDKKVISFSGERATPYMFKRLIKLLDSQLDVSSNCKRVLYEMLSELSENAWKYAYPHEHQRGYIYMIIKNNEKCLNVFFLDMGVGIPNSVRHKQSRSRIDNKLKLITSDSDIIARALLGDYKISSTGLKKHGKGLPMIFSTVARERACELMIVSGSAYCCLSHTHGIKLNELPESFKGTLFCWEMQKQLK